MTEPLRWGVLGCAKIAVEKVIPAIQGSKRGVVTAIASRAIDLAQATARKLDIERAYGSYQELLADPDVRAVYIPLPNHLHAEWTLAAAEAGKHVLCEKPLGMSSEEARSMVEGCQRDGVKLMEAFMYRLHPLWKRAYRLVAQGDIGELLAIQSFFSYRNVDPTNIRNLPEYGGGALMDIGCYPVNVARMFFQSEPQTVKAAIRTDPNFGTDVVTSALLDFGGRHAVFTCSTQLEDNQRVELVGTQGRFVIEIPYNVPPDIPTRLMRYAGGNPPVDPDVEVIEIDPADPYQVQADAFAEAIRQEAPVPFEPTDAVANLQVLERIVADAGSGGA